MFVSASAVNPPKLPLPTVVFLLIVGAALTAAMLHVKLAEKEAKVPVPVLPAGELPVLELDELHNILAHAGDSSVPKYVMAPASGFILDVSQYRFSTVRLPPGVTAPNHLSIRTPTGFYNIPLQAGQSRYEISVRTVTADPDGPESGPFQANSPGEMHIFITYYRPASGLTPAITYDVWLGTVSVVRP